MSSLGHLLFSGQDEAGEVQVYDNGARRLLAFGPGDEQSACLKSEPGLLLFEYTQAMMLGLLFASPRKVLCLGLGAGSLVTALLSHCKGVKITAVELRPLVFELAQRYFYLPRSKNLQIQIEDAATFISQDSGHYDLIFCDLYTATGAAPVQNELDFLSACRARLKPEGLFVINSWRQEKLPNQADLDQLKQVFPSLGACLTSEGNWVLFGRRLPFSTTAQLKAPAQQWSRQLGFSLSKHLRNFRVLN